MFIIQRKKRHILAGMARSRRKKVVDENEKQQPIDNDANECWRKDAFCTVLANAKQGDDSQTQPCKDKQQGD